MTIEEQSYISQTEAFVRQKLTGEGSGHDWWHIYRVWNNAKSIMKGEKPKEPLVVELAALLHDIADHKFHQGDTTIGPRIGGDWLRKLGVPDPIIDHVQEIILHVSYKGAHVKNEITSLEGMIVQDADRLDAIGAIGIARTFAYGGHVGQLLYDPHLSPTLHDSFEAYKKEKTTTINHFYEKLLLLKDRMNTPTAQKMALHRHRYMEEFLQKFFTEWNGED